MRRFLAVCAFVATGCEAESPSLPDLGDEPAVPSSSVSPSDLSATLVVTARGDGSASVFGALQRGWSRTNVRLVAPDALRVEDPGSTLDLVADRFAANVTTYRAEIREPEGRVGVTLVHRGAELPSAVELPPAFALTAATARVSRSADDVVLTWAPSDAGDRMFFYASGDCISMTGEVDVEDVGTLTIPRGTLSGQGSCDVTISVRRSRHGSTSPAFGRGATIRGEQLRTVTLFTDP